MRPYKAAWCDAVADSMSLTHTQRLVAFRLASYANKDGTEARPSHDRLARECGLKDRSSVQRAIKVLLRDGFLVLARKANPMLGFKTNSYTLAFPERRGATAPSLAFGDDYDEVPQSDEALVPPGAESGPIRRGATAEPTRRASTSHEAREPQDQALDQPKDHFVFFEHDPVSAASGNSSPVFGPWTCTCRAANDDEECCGCGAFRADFPTAREWSRT